MLPSSLSNPVFTHLPNKTISHHHRKTRTAIFAYFRKRSFSAPKTHNFCQLTKTHDFHNLHHNICISPNPESESAENTFLPRKIRHFSCWQFLWMNRPISMKTIFLNMCFYNVNVSIFTLRIRLSFYSPLSNHNYLLLPKTQIFPEDPHTITGCFWCWQLNSYTYLYRKRIPPRFRKLFTGNQCVTNINSYYIRASMDTAAFST